MLSQSDSFNDMQSTDEQYDMMAIPDRFSMDVLVVGPVFLDVVLGPVDAMPIPGEERWVSQCAFAPGGAANQAVALARLGLSSRLCSYLGTDEPGILLQSLLRKEGLSEEGMVEVAHQSVTASISVANDRAMVTYGTNEAPKIVPETKPRALMADLRAIAMNRPTLEKWRASSLRPLVISDVGWDDSGRWDPKELNGLDLVDYFVPNAGEACRYTRTTCIRDAAYSLQSRVPVVVITNGAEGLFAYDGTTEVELPAIAVDAVDPTGAGDVFGAALTWCALQEFPLRESLSVASLAAACSVQAFGGSLSAPSLEQIRNLIQSIELPSQYAIPEIMYLDRPLTKERDQ